MSNHNIDHNRQERVGFAEIIYGASKSLDDLKRIVTEYNNRNKNALVTKLQAEKANELLIAFPNAFYDVNAQVFLLQALPEEKKPNMEVAIISAGTSDIHVVNEAFYTLLFLGVSVDRICDVGVAGIHRLMDRIGELKQYKVLIVVAGFEGALPSVIGGLLPQPIIGVPSDVGYGIAKGGKVALNSMLASCANGITVMNINNGFGAAMAAFRILKQVNG